MFNPEDLFRRLQPIIPEKISNLWLAYNSATNFKQKQEVILNLQQLHSKYLDCDYFENNSILLPPPMQKEGGEYEIGEIYYANKQFGIKFNLNNKALLNHTIVAGSSGTGKSNFIAVLTLQLLKTKINFLILDWKASYRNIIPKQKDKLKVYTLGRNISPFSFNIWIPPENTSISEWVLFLIDIMERAYYLGLGVRDIMMQAAKSAFINKGFTYQNGEFIPPENPIYPTNHDILNAVHAIKTGFRSDQWKQSTLRALQSLTFGAMGRICNDSKPLEDIFNQPVILEMDVLSEADKAFIAQFLLLYRYRYLLRKEGEREVLNHLFIIDEAHEILKKPNYNTNESIIDEIWRNVRELGQGIIACAQNPSLISVSCLTNSFTTISFSLKSTQDIKQISGNLLLEKHQEQYIGLLKTGQAIVKHQGQYRKPFHIAVSPLDIAKGSVTDRDLAKYMSQFTSQNTKESAITKPIPSGKRLKTADSRNTKTIQRIPVSDKYKHRKEAEALKDIAEYPFSAVVERYERLGLSAHKGNEIINNLINKGIIEKVFVIKENTRLTLFDFTEKGLQKLTTLNIDRNSHYRHGKVEHRYYCDYISEKLSERKYGLLRECPTGNGTTADIVFFNSSNLKCAVEVETGKSDYQKNIKNAIKQGFDHIFVIATSDEVKKKIKRNKIKSSKLHILSVKEFHKVLKILDKNA